MRQFIVVSVHISMKKPTHRIFPSRSTLVATISLCTVMGLAYSGHPQTQAGKDSTKVEDIKNLLTVTGATDSLIKRFRESAGQSTNPAPTGLSKQIVQNVEPIQKLIEAQIATYDEHFSHEDIRELVRFYESPVGKKLLTEMPKVSLQEAETLRIWQRQVASRPPGVIEKGKADPPRRMQYTEEQRRAAVRYFGFDPETHTFDEMTGTIAPKPQPEPKPVQLPKEVRFIIEVRNSSGSKTTYYSKTEPKPYGSGFKFQMYPTDVEITVSDPVTIFKLP